jgi:hypothetical protein
MDILIIWNGKVVARSLLELEVVLILLMMKYDLFM